MAIIWYFFLFALPASWAVTRNSRSSTHSDDGHAIAQPPGFSGQQWYGHRPQTEQSTHTQGVFWAPKLPHSPSASALPPLQVFSCLPNIAFNSTAWDIKFTDLRERRTCCCCSPPQMSSMRVFCLFVAFTVLISQVTIWRIAALSKTASVSTAKGHRGLYGPNTTRAPRVLSCASPSIQHAIMLSTLTGSVPSSRASLKINQSILLFLPRSLPVLPPRSYTLNCPT